MIKNVIYLLLIMNSLPC